VNKMHSSIFFRYSRTSCLYAT